MTATVTHHVSVSLALSGSGVQPAGFGSVAFIGDIDWADDASTVELLGPYTSLSELSDAGASTNSPEYLWATALLSQRPRVTSFYVVHNGGGDYSDALDAVVATDPGAFYAVCTESRSDSDITDIAAAVEALNKIYIAQTSDATTLSDGSGYGATFNTAGYNNSALIWHDTDTEYLDAAWVSRCLSANLDQKKNGWSYKQLAGIDAGSYTSTQTSNLRGVNVNYYAPVAFTAGNEASAFTYPGQMASGRRIDTTVSLHWLQARLEEEFFNVFARETHQVPYNDAGIARFAAAFNRVMSIGIAAGHIEPFTIPEGEDDAGRTTPFLVLPKSADISSTVRNTGVLTFSGVAYLRGSIERVSFSMELKT